MGKTNQPRNKDQTLVLQLKTKTVLYRKIRKVPKFHYLKTNKYAFLLRERNGDLFTLTLGEIHYWKVFTFLNSLQGCDEQDSILRLYFLKCHYPSARTTNGWLGGKIQFGGH